MSSNLADSGPVRPADGPAVRTETLAIHDIRLEINAADNGGQHYKQRQHVEEARSPLWPLLRERLAPQVVIDVGANYGFTSSVFARALGPRQVVTIEPDPNLTDFLQRNLARNVPAGIDVRVLSSMVGAEDRGESSFGLNPNASQDNRVHPAGNWPTCTVPVRSLGSLLAEFAQGRPTFIKIDTQGYDPVVLRSGVDYLGSHDNWLARSEFAPHWMLSQQQDPVGFLVEMTRRFRVFEAPARVPCFATLDSVFQAPLPEDESLLEQFVRHVESLNSHRRGWVDIFLVPRTACWRS